MVEIGAGHVADGHFVFADPDLDRGRVEVVEGGVVAGGGFGVWCAICVSGG